MSFAGHEGDAEIPLDGQRPLFEPKVDHESLRDGCHDDSFRSKLSFDFTYGRVLPVGRVLRVEGGDQCNDSLCERQLCPLVVITVVLAAHPANLRHHAAGGSGSPSVRNFCTVSLASIVASTSSRNDGTL